MTMQAGTYYVGDLCYVMGDVWDEVCDITIQDVHTMLDGEFNLADGRRFAMYSTAFGDGTYPSNGFGSFSVDSGSIGCIRVEDITDPEFNIDTIRRLGNIVEMKEGFVTSVDEGTINIGGVLIETAGYDDEYDEEYYEDIGE